MKIRAVITTVNRKEKQEWLKKVAKSIDNSGCSFDDKIVFIDNISHDKFDDELKNELLQCGWTILFAPNFGRLQSLVYLTAASQGFDFILHAEDDILVTKLPDRKLLETILSSVKNAKKCAQLTLSLGGSTFKCDGGDSGDFDHIESQLIYLDKDVMAFRRMEEYASSFFFELGTMFVNPKIMKECLTHAHKFFPGMQIEQAMTAAWFDLEISNDYYRATLCKPLLKDVYLNEPRRADGECRFIEILDPDQGASLYGGNHLT